MGLIKRADAAYTIAHKNVKELYKVYFPSAKILADARGPVVTDQRLNRPKCDDWSCPQRSRDLQNQPFKSAGLLQKRMEVLLPNLTNIFRASITWWCSHCTAIGEGNIPT